MSAAADRSSSGSYHHEPFQQSATKVEAVFSFFVGLKLKSDHGNVPSRTEGTGHRSSSDHPCVKIGPLGAGSFYFYAPSAIFMLLITPSG